MSGTLHTLAMVAGGISLVSVVADRGRGRFTECAAAALMLVAMADSAQSEPFVPVVAWMGSLIAAALIVSASGRLGGQAPAQVGPAGGGLRAHSAVGLIVMAALLAGSIRTDPISAAPAHAHGGVGELGIPLLCVALGYAVVSTLVAARSRTAVRGIHLAAMGASAGLMGIGVAL